MCQQRLLSRAGSFALVAILSALAYAAAVDEPDCGEMQCHKLTWCEFNSTGGSVCVCQPGTVDKSGGAGLDCHDKGYSVRFVAETSADISENPTASWSREDAMDLCHSSAEGYFLRQMVGTWMEVNCIYSTKPVDTSAYGNTAASGLEYVTSPSGLQYVVPPAIYSWELPTTDNPLKIPPTGMEVNSVQFKTSCAETGCWVIKGTMTTGDAFNEAGAINTFFLPQANISGLHPQGDISYDYNYDAVEWTFSPANHPCTSAAYEAGAAGSNTHKISTCCISKPTEGSTGGFVANYRPTEAFVHWAGKLGCDVVFDRDGEGKCWKLFTELNTFDAANQRCAVAGGRLAKVANQDEKTLMDNFMRTLEPEGLIGDPVLWRAGRAWIGLKQFDGTYSWVDGSNYTFDLGFTSNGECGWLSKGVNYGSESCTQQREFVCEFDPPVFDAASPCIKHVIQRPKYSAPSPARPCWNVKPYNERTDFAGAEAVCASEGGFLPVIDDAEENWFFRRLLDYKGVWHSWLGLTANVTGLATDEAPVWSYPDGVARPSLYDGTYHSLIDRAPSVPANVGPIDQWCVTVQPGGRWANSRCTPDLLLQPVCEFDRDTLPAGTVCDSDELENLHPNWDIVFPINPTSFIDVGKFKGMPTSPGIVDLTNLDPFFGQFSFEIHLDEVELRSEAGKLRGTVGVEHTVDTYLGLANFRPTGIEVLDTFATQVNIHLEKTSFFSVSTHGVNDFTFLEYVNMRLISIYTQDVDFSGLNETGDRTVRTDSSGNANYVQVTFTMGDQYQPNPDSGGLIPLDSVRAGRGTFIGDADLQHLCSMYTEGNATAGDDIGLTVDGTSFADDISIFNAMLDQRPCGPQSSMCVSPQTVPDQFVSFNIPLGFQVFDGQASNSLENSIFVSMVINALDKGPTAGPTPNNGNDPLQMRTTLEASIPIVDGGINIFCDGITAKTDLKDVANADIIVGSAASVPELTRLRIIEDVANTNLAQTPSANVDSDSIEAGLMTLVLKGNSSYFENGVVNTQGYSLELDDVITIHLMTDGEAPAETDAQCAAAITAGTEPADCALRALLSEAPDDNLDSNGLDTDAYKLNGAFKFDVDRGLGIAKLEPTSDLLAICPFNPPRPSGGLYLESCITRRDVRSRTYPKRQGAAGPTAMEILAQTDDLVSDSLTNEMQLLEAQRTSTCTCSEGDDEDHDTAEDECCEAGFMQMILGENDYARDLAVDYVKAIHERYTLNGRYNRAYWINPGYEWTPTQTAGKSLFSVSQKVYLFALITLDENISRRRMLLATDVSPTEDSGSGVGGAQLAFPVARTSIMAQAFDVPAEKAVVFNVEMQLTQDEACMSDNEFVAQARATLEDYLDTAASSFHSVQVLGFSRDLNGVACSRRALRKLLADYSAATASVQMLIVYKDEGEALFNSAEFAKMAGITSVAVDAASAANVKVDATYHNPVPNSKEDDESSSSSSTDTALIAGIAGGVGGAVLLAAGAFVFRRNRGSQTAVAEPVQTIDVNGLKAELSNDV